ncbi:hypothetical protein FACS1894161_3270 [Spirochaetia bacterium]|nr:hypothetical protein FACS1894161_3270 [Spirochaetia bacterium]
MVVASIDIQGGKVVQLKQGSELVLQRDNAPELAEEFNRYGETAVIDIDAATGKGNNLEMIKPLLRKAECRVGGGIRTPEQAKELVSLGAVKIIVGSQVFRDPAKKGAGIVGGEFAVNTGFLEAMANSPRDCGDQHQTKNAVVHHLPAFPFFRSRCCLRRCGPEFPF